VISFINYTFLQKGVTTQGIIIKRFQNFCRKYFKIYRLVTNVTEPHNVGTAPAPDFMLQIKNLFHFVAAPAMKMMQLFVAPAN
jgi:hypothetical protein